MPEIRTVSCYICVSGGVEEVTDGTAPTETVHVKGREREGQREGETVRLVGGH